MRIKLWSIVCGLGLTAIAVGLLVFVVRNNNAGQRDFIEYWAAGQQLIHGANPYDDAAIFPMQRAAGLEDSHAKISYSPPVAFFLFLPLGLVSANTGLLLWFFALLVCLVASVRMLWNLHGRPSNGLHLLAYCFAPVMECMMAGQLGIFLLIGIVLFLYLHQTKPFLAGAALLPCVLKPHLFLPFGIVLLLWVVGRKSYRILAGFFTILLANSALTLGLDIHIWSQYRQMMRTTGVLDTAVPTLSAAFRFLIDGNAIWLQFLPEGVACAWALWYFWTRRTRWDWMEQGMVVLLVSAVCTPYGWLTDETMLLPAILAGIYRADESGRSLLPFGIIAGVAMLEVFAKLPLTNIYYLWTTPAWLGWYLYATRRARLRSDSAEYASAPQR